MIPFLMISALLSATAPAAASATDAAASAADKSVQEIRLIIGEAFPLEGGAGAPQAYVEEHRERLEGDRTVSMSTVYRDVSGTVLAERTLDFSASSSHPGYALKDLRSGMEEGATVRGKVVRVRSRASKASETREKDFKVPEPFVIDGGFHSFLKGNWDALIGGKRISFYFVVPSRLDFFRFVAYEDPSRAAHGAGERVFVAIPQSRVLRMVVEPIVVRYDAASRRMKEYRGLSNIEGPGGKPQKVRLVYREPGL
ncbi:MAG: hypothetical protein JWP91_4238 [Fibrobacteres bacterium]|nr:hypothetical protein [Fibrobacterota bacterium]